jgi:4-hydroxy-3-methylbut-2-enyl diphosphate reductase
MITLALHLPNALVVPTPACLDCVAASQRSGLAAVRMQGSAEVIKREERRRIMGTEKYKRGGAPFDKAIHKDVASKMTEKFKSELVAELKESSFREVTQGDGNAAVTFELAKEYGFCWGVERSIELAWAARDAYPDKKIHITNELIHNPGVNDMLADMNVAFIEKTGGADGGKRFDTVEEGDVVILPAFGASLEEMQLLDKRDVTVVDTTCPWVSKVWTTVDKHQRADMTSIIHGARPNLHLHPPPVD